MIADIFPIIEFRALTADKCTCSGCAYRELEKSRKFTKTQAIQWLQETILELELRNAAGEEYLTGFSNPAKRLEGIIFTFTDYLKRCQGNHPDEFFAASRLGQSGKKDEGP